MREEILHILKTSPEKFLGLDEILKKMSYLKGFEGKKLRRTLQEMVDEGSVVVTSRGKFALGISIGVMTGKILGNARGFAFFVPDDSDEDLFISEQNLNGACHGDRVEVKEIRQKGRKKNTRYNARGRREGEVVKIIERGIQFVVGIVENSPAGTLVIPDDKRFTDEIFIENGEKVANGLKVVVKVTDWPTRTTMCRGEIYEVLGDAKDLKVSTLSVVRSFQLFETFPDNVLAEAKKVPQSVSPEEIKGRTDFRNDLVITIDGDDARDFDDAISLTRTKDGLYRLSVHIADVSHYVRTGSALNGEAFRRGTSVYFPDMVLPMLPVELSNNICSLNENVDRLTLSVVMDINNKGDVVNYNICNGVIKSRNRMTYKKVTKILEGDAEMCKMYAHLVPMLKEMAKLTEILLAKRDGLGQIDFELPETEFELNDKYEVLGVREKPRTLADRLIEQFMVLTNEVVAEHFCKLKVPFVYRVHEAPLPEKLKAFNEFVKTFDPNARLPIADIKPKEVQEFLKTLAGLPYEKVINKVMLRSMQKALYYERCNGHFGLASKYYCHFTSPIRRYPDLAIHRIIKAYLAGGLENKREYFEKFVHEASELSSERERIADDAERAVDDLKRAEYMQKHIGEEYVGICNGVTENGIFVMLDNTCEGFVHTDDMPMDTYYLEQARYRLVGKRNTFQLGDEIKIQVSSVDLAMRRVNFAFIEKVGGPQSAINPNVMSGNIDKRRAKNAKRHR